MKFLILNFVPKYLQQSCKGHLFLIKQVNNLKNYQHMNILHILRLTLFMKVSMKRLSHYAICPSFCDMSGFPVLNYFPQNLINVQLQYFVESVLSLSNLQQKYWITYSAVALINIVKGLVYGTNGIVHYSKKVKDYFLFEKLSLLTFLKLSTLGCSTQSQTLCNNWHQQSVALISVWLRAYRTAVLGYFQQ